MFLKRARRENTKHSPDPPPGRVREQARQVGLGLVKRELRPLDEKVDRPPDALALPGQWFDQGTYDREDLDRYLQSPVRFGDSG